MSKTRDKHIKEFKAAYEQYMKFLEQRLERPPTGDPLGVSPKLAVEPKLNVIESLLRTNYTTAEQNDFDLHHMHYLLSRIEKSEALNPMLTEEPPITNTLAIKNYEFFRKMVIAALKLDDPEKTKENKLVNELREMHEHEIVQTKRIQATAEELEKLRKDKPIEKVIGDLKSDMKADKKSQKTRATTVARDTAQVAKQTRERHEELESVKKASKANKDAMDYENDKVRPAVTDIMKLLADYKASLKNEPNSKEKISAINKIEVVLNGRPTQGTEKEKFERAKKLWEHQKLATIFSQRRDNGKSIVKSKIFWLLDALFNRKNFNFEFGVKGRKTAKQVNRLFDNPAKAMQAKSKSKLDKAKVEKTTSRSSPRR